jgi:DNA-binding SARP family transcriptional activator
VANWLKKLFGGKPPLTPEEIRVRKVELHKALLIALIDGPEREWLRLAEELIELDPQDASGWNQKVGALEYMGRHDAARRTAEQAAKVLGKNL